MLYKTVLKRLFAESGNICAFPGCQTELIHRETGSVVGEICHIKAKNKGGPRYDENQSVDERDGYENLVLLCSVHHKVVDDHPAEYPVERLHELKRTHRNKNLQRVCIGSELLRKLETNVSVTNVVNGSVITSINQSGGQVAHTINNYGPVERTLSDSVKQQMMSILSECSTGKIGFASTQGDMEAHKFKEALMSVFLSAGWSVRDMKTFQFFDVQQGLRITIPQSASEEGAPQIVWRALTLTNNPVSASKGDMANECGIFVQVWSAP